MKNIVLVVAACFLSGCSFMVKTPVVADYNNFETIDRGTTKNDIAVLLGTPQGDGTHVQNGTQNELQFYYGFAGNFSLSGAKYDSGTAFISYKGNKPADITYFTSKASGPEIRLNKNLSIKSVADKVALGSSRVDAVFQALGRPDFVGKRLNFEHGIDHKVAFWEASEVQTKGAIKEKWLLVGFDYANIVQDLVWVSSRAEDIQEFGSVSEQQLRQLSRATVAGFFPILEPTGMNTGTKIDSVQVDALIKTAPKNIKDVIRVLGPPSALGIKSFAADTPMGLSNWSFSNVEMKGEEHNFIPPGATEEERKNLQGGASFMVMSVEQSRLMIGHTADGQIKEIIWVKPIKQ